MLLAEHMHWARTLILGLREYLRREHPIVARTGEAFAASGLDVASEVGDADDLDERDLHLNRRWYEDGIHRVVGHALTNQGQVQHQGYVMGLEVVSRAQPTQHKKLWAAQCSSGYDDFVFASVT